MFTISSGKEKNESKVLIECALETDAALIGRADRGKIRQVCKLCGAQGDFQTWEGIEMFVGLRDSFDYFICPECETLQIEKFPDNIGKYYAHDYYSFQKPPIEPADPGAKRDERMVLDVGCGAGAWLCSLASLGLVNLFGCDPFIESDITYGNGVIIKKCSVHDMEGEYDVIRLWHSFEHMPDPHKVFESFGRLLKREGTYGDTPKVEIAIPIFPNAAFDIYGPYWYQMDPPRHYFLHSVKGMEYLARRYGFIIDDVRYNGNSTQYIVSRMYQMGSTLIGWQSRLENYSVFAKLKAQIPVFDALSSFANTLKCADQAVFTLSRHV